MEGTLAEIRLFGGNFSPRNWAFCFGQLLPINSNQALFSLLGTTYGGDGRTTFGLPDFRGRRGVHAGHGPGLNPIQLGAKGGKETHTMTTSEMPKHSHDIVGSLTIQAAQRAYSDVGGQEEPGDGYYSKSDGVTFFSDTSDATLAPAHVTVDTSQLKIGDAGASQWFDLRAPWEAIYYIICTSGTFPSRN
jgi:microcystin-dependent protein